jgi:pimeloyl-ACP methyl ester carboxylesterase
VPTSFSVEVAGTGRPVILIPGLGCPGAVWDDTIAHLHAQTHVLTLAGFADRPAMESDAPLVATARDELVRYIRDRHLEHPVVIGHSLGGMLALGVAADAPELVGPTIVVDASPDFDPETPLAKKQATAKELRDGLIAASAADWTNGTRQMFSAMTTNPRRLEPVIAAVLRSDRRAFANALYEVFTADLRPELAKIRAPVLFVLAADSPKEGIDRQAHAIASHDVRAIARTKHFVMLDDPAGFYAVIDPFLAAHP